MFGNKSNDFIAKMQVFLNKQNEIIDRATKPSANMRMIEQEIIENLCVDVNANPRATYYINTENIEVRSRQYAETTIQKRSPELQDSIDQAKQNDKIIKLSKDKTHNAIIIIPIKLHNNVVTVLCAEAKSDAFNDSEIILIDMYAHLIDHIANTIATSVNTYISKMRQIRKDMSEQLDFILADLPSDSFVEVMGYIPDPEQIFTIALNPDSSSGLHFRVRAGEGRMGIALQQKQSMLSPVVESGSIDDTHLRKTRSALIIILKRSDGSILGALNIEHDKPNTLTEEIQTKIQAKYSAKISQLLEDYPLENVTDNDVIDTMLHDAESQIFNIIDPNDLKSDYWQLLRIAAQIVCEVDVSAGLLLKTDLMQNIRLRGIPSSSDEEEGYISVYARMGNYTLERKQWRLKGLTNSGSQEVFRTGKAIKLYPNDPRWQNLGADYANGSELLIPILDKNQIIGVIDLISPKPEAFNDEDQEHLEILAKTFTHLLLRIKDIQNWQRNEQKLRYTSDIQQRLASLFVQDENSLLELAINKITQTQKIHDEILQYILGEACKKIGVINAQILLEHDQKLFIHTIHGNSIPNAKRFWSINDGITGKAFREQITIVEQETEIGKNDYFSGFWDTRSEVATDISRGNECLGVLDLQSSEPFHFLEEHTLWIEFFADLLALTINQCQMALEIAIDLATEDLSNDIDRKIDTLRQVQQQEYDAIRRMRNEALHELALNGKKLTGAEFVRVLSTINAYSLNPITGVRTFAENQGADVNECRLLELYTTEEPKTAQINHQVFELTPKLRSLFEDAGIHSLKYTDVSSVNKEAFFGQDVFSALLLPIYEGPYIIGIVSFEWTRRTINTASWFEISNIDTLEIAQKIALMMSDVYVSAKIRREELRQAIIRQFDIDILSRPSMNILELIEIILQYTQKLTKLKKGWTKFIQIHHYSSDEPNVYRILQEKQLQFTEQTSQFVPNLVKETFDENHPKITDPILTKVISSKYAWFSLDITRESLFLGKEIPEIWKNARSLLCVPLLQPKSVYSTNKPESVYQLDQMEIYGFLIAAANEPRKISDIDEHILTLFSQVIIFSLQNKIAINRQSQVVQEINHDYGKALSFFKTMLQTAEKDPESLDIHQANAMVNLLEGLVNWIINLNQPTINMNVQLAVPIKNLWDAFKSSLDIFAGLFQRKIIWDAAIIDSDTKYIENRWNIITSCLFKYIENALKYSSGTGDITVQIKLLPNQALEISVRNPADEIPQEKADLLFEQRLPSDVESSRTGIGLPQVKVLIEKLSGSVKYQYIPTAKQVEFSLTVPLAQLKGR